MTGGIAAQFSLVCVRELQSFVCFCVLGVRSGEVRERVSHVSVWVAARVYWYMSARIGERTERVCR